MRATFPLAVSALLALTACDDEKDPQDLIVGTWQCQSTFDQERWTSRIEYRADGTYLELETFEYPERADERIDIRDEGTWFFAGKTLIEKPQKFAITSFTKGNQDLPTDQVPQDFKDYVAFAEDMPFGVKIEELTERVFNTADYETGFRTTCLKIE